MSIFVIDDHPLMRDAICAILRRLNPKIQVAELNSLDATEIASREYGTPDLICVELTVGGSEGVAAVERLKCEFGNVPIIVLSGADAAVFEKPAFEAGARAYLHKSASRLDIAGAFREFLAPLEGGEGGAEVGKLSKRQKQLLLLLDKGVSNRDIAAQLKISEHTVKVHLWRLFRRLNVKSRSQASHLARTHGLLEQQPGTDQRRAD